MTRERDAAPETCAAGCRDGWWYVPSLGRAGEAGAYLPCPTCNADARRPWRRPGYTWPRPRVAR